LSEARKKEKDGKYQKCLQILEGKGFIFPSQMISAYGIKNLPMLSARVGLERVVFLRLCLMALACLTINQWKRISLAFVRLGMISPMEGAVAIS
jgi:hypothetical protein